jgi:hypothetical protein
MAATLYPLAVPPRPWHTIGLDYLISTPRTWHTTKISRLCFWPFSTGSTYFFLSTSSLQIPQRNCSSGKVTILGIVELIEQKSTKFDGNLQSLARSHCKSFQPILTGRGSPIISTTSPEFAVLLKATHLNEEGAPKYFLAAVWREMAYNTGGGVPRPES